MDTTVPDELIAAGLAIGLAIGLVLLARGLLDKSRTAASLAGLVLIAAAAIALIAGSWTARVAVRPWLEAAEFALIVATGPLTVIIAAALLRTEVRAAWLVAVAASAFVAVMLLTLRFGGDPVLYGVPIQAAYVLYGWLLLAKRSPPIDRRHRAYRQRMVAIGLLAALTAASAASVVRMVFADAAALRPIVPLTISLLLIALLLILLWLLLKRSSGLLGASPEADTALADQAAALIERDELFRDQELKVETVAERLDVPSTALASALAASDWGSFAAMVQALRVEQVRRMLCDPGERRTSVEAIGLLCGFRSRSALYEAFQRRFGMSPGDYRRKSCPET